MLYEHCICGTIYIGHNVAAILLASVMPDGRSCLSDKTSQTRQVLSHQHQPCAVCQVLELTAQVQFFTENFVDKHAVLRADTKLRDYESRLDLEYSQRQRLEVGLLSVVVGLLSVVVGLQIYLFFSAGCAYSMDT